MSECTKCADNRESPKLVLPAWMAPGFQLAASEMVYTSFTTLNATEQTLLPADPKRWAVGFAIPVSPGPALIFGPNSGTAQRGFAFNNNQTSYWFFPMQHGPLASYQWYYSATAAFNLAVYEILLT